MGSREEVVAALRSRFCGGSIDTGVALPSVSRDSQSLWNTSMNQGWSEHEETILILANKKFGVGHWRKILASGCLPGKCPAQMYLQTQRILGQQSIAEFTGLHVDCGEIGKINKAKTEGVVRKNRLITNTGGKLPRSELLAKWKVNKEMFEVPESEWSAINLPVPPPSSSPPSRTWITPPDSATAARVVAEKKTLLITLEAELKLVRERISEVKKAIVEEEHQDRKSLKKKKRID